VLAEMRGSAFSWESLRIRETSMLYSLLDRFDMVRRGANQSGHCLGGDTMKKNWLRIAVVLSGFAFGVTGVAHAAVLFFPGPEVDPTLAIGALTLVAGTVAVLRARRGK